MKSGKVTVWKKLAMALGIILVMAIVLWQFIEPTERLDVQLITPEIKTLSTTLDLNSVVINNQIVTITALLDGQIVKIEAREGETVKNGQALALLDSQQAQALLNKAQAQLDYKKQKYNSASRSYTRIKDLSTAGSTSKQTLDEALDELLSTRSEMNVSEADISLAELQIQNSTVSAPFDGVVTRQFAESGQWVEAGTPMFTLAAKDTYLIEAQVDASDWTSVSVGQPVTLSADSSPGKFWQSRVSWIAPTVANSARDVKAVAIRFPMGENAPALLLGEEVDAELILAQVTNALTLPLSAMIENAPNEFGVFVINGNKTQWTPVEIGLQNRTHAQITAGLTNNTRVIVARGGKLEDGMLVDF